MVIETKNFGSVNVDDENIFFFENGIPGFEELHKFAIIKTDEEEKKSPFVWLQSLDDVNISFIMMSAYEIMPDYNPLVYDDELESLGEIEGENLLIYNIVVVPEIVSKMSINLKAPVVINLTTKRGKQVITKNEDYPIKYYFYEELKNKKGGE